jgi:pyruvate dehydrogenase E1 component
MNTTVDGEFQKYSVETAPTSASTSSARPAAAQDGRAPLRRRAAHAAARRPRLPQALRRLQGGHRARGQPPTVILAKTIKGWTLGPDVEGRNATHQIKKMTNDQLKVLRDRLHLHDEVPTSAREGDDPPYYRPRDSIEHQYLMERRRALDGPLPRRVVRPAPALEPRDTAFDECSAARASRRCRPRWRSPACCGTCARDPEFGPGWCRSSPTRPARSAWTRCSRSSASTPRRARSTSRSTTTCCSPTRVQHGQILEEGITEAGSMPASSPPARQLRHPRRADGALLHLLLDVRLPAGRRPDLGRRPTSGPRVPARRHRRPHHAQRRGPPAPGRPQPAARLHQPGRRGLRPGVRLRGGRDRPARHASACTAPTPRTSSTTSPSTTRTTRCRPCRTGVAEGIMEGLYRWAPRPTGRPRGPPSCSRVRPRAPPAPAASELAEHYDVGVELWSATSYKALREEALAVERWNRLHPTQAARTPLVARAAPTPRAGRGGDGLHEDGPRAGGPVRPQPAVPAARHRRLRSQRHPGGAAAHCSRSTRPTWWSPCCRRWQPPAR